MRSESRLAKTFSCCAISVLLATVCALPWIHGGAIPLARLVLQLGACLAGVLSLLSGLLSRRRGGFPPVVFPLGVLVCVGVLQLLPVHAPMVSQMNRAVLAELRHDLPVEDSPILTQRSGSPADTRMIVAQLVALMLLAITAYDQIRSRRSVRFALAVFMSNALLFSLLAFVQMFRRELFLIRPEWWTGLGLPFGTFVNPNNAAGWLCMGLASALGFLMLQLQPRELQSSQGQKLPIGLFQQLVRYFAELSALKIASVCSIVVIACAIVATRSRGAMIATGLSFVLITVLRLRMRHLVGTVVVSLVAAFGVYASILFLNLDEIVISELSTLYDPVAAVAPRIAHWKDSLQAVLDFPILGTGLGAYRYVTLPYQASDAGVWFQHADNEYVELIVEAGIVGFFAFVLIGGPVFLRSVRVVRNAVVGGARPIEEAVALVLVFATFTQGLFSCFDYGAVLPAAASLFVVLVSMLATVANQPDNENKGAELLPKVMMQLTLVVAAGVFVGDLAAAQRCYLVSIAGRTVTKLPVTEASLRERSIILAEARSALDDRTDDPDVHEAISKLSSDLLRAEFVKGLPGLDQDGNLERVWPYTSCIGIVRRIDAKENEPDLTRHLQGVLATRVEQSGIIAHCQQVLQDMPVPVVILRRAARWVAAARLESDVKALALLARFCEPANGRLGLQLGEIALRRGQETESSRLFSLAMRSAPVLRGEVLAVYSAADRLEQGLGLFEPESYAEAVTAMQNQSDEELFHRLDALASSYWVDPTSRPPLSEQFLRNDHLRLLRDRRRRITWLRRCVEWTPDNARLHTDLAILLKQNGQLEESLREWQEVLRIRPDDRSALRGMSQLRRALKADNSRSGS